MIRHRHDVPSCLCRAVFRPDRRQPLGDRRDAPGHGGGYPSPNRPAQGALLIRKYTCPPADAACLHGNASPPFSMGTMNATGEGVADMEGDEKGRDTYMNTLPRALSEHPKSSTSSPPPSWLPFSSNAWTSWPGFSSGSPSNSFPLFSLPSQRPQAPWPTSLACMHGMLLSSLVTRLPPSLSEARW